MAATVVELQKAKRFEETTLRAHCGDALSFLGIKWADIKNMDANLPLGIPLEEGPHKADAAELESYLQEREDSEAGLALERDREG